MSFLIDREEDDQYCNVELTNEQVDKLAEIFIEEYKWTKDNFERAFDYWLGTKSAEELEDLLKSL